jgi:HEAT repeat protein
MPNLKRAIACFVVLFIVAAAIVFWMDLETVADRERVALHLQDLARRIENDPTDSGALDEIREILNGNWSFARTYACTTLVKLGPKATAATPDLIQALNSGDPFVEREAARALGTVAVGRPEAVGPLIEKLVYDDDDVGWFAARSLGDIGMPARRAIPFLERAAESANRLMADEAKDALGKLTALEQE